METMLALWQHYILGLGRVLTLVMVAPVLGSSAVPRSIKVVTALVLAAFCVPLAPANASGLIATLPFSALLVKEMAIGYCLGFTLLLLLAAFQAAGELMGFQMMLSASTAFLPSSQEPTTVSGSFVYIFSLLVFIGLNGHHWLVAALHQSFRALPVTGFPATLGPFAFWMALVGQWFAIGLKLAMPLLATLLITNLLMGMIARTMPQINIFVVGMPVQIMVGLVVLALMLVNLHTAETALFKDWAKHLMQWVGMISR